MENPLVRLREKLELTKEDLAFLLNLSVTTISRIEKGNTKVPPKCFNHLEKLGVNPMELAAEQEQFIETKRKEFLASIQDKLSSREKDK